MNGCLAHACMQRFGGVVGKGRPVQGDSQWQRDSHMGENQPVQHSTANRRLEVWAAHSPTTCS